MAMENPNFLWEIASQNAGCSMANVRLQEGAEGTDCSDASWLQIFPLKGDSPVSMPN